MIAMLIDYYTKIKQNKMVVNLYPTLLRWYFVAIYSSLKTVRFGCCSIYKWIWMMFPVC